MFSLISDPNIGETVVVVGVDGEIRSATYDGNGYIAHLLNNRPVYYSRGIIEAVYRYTPTSAP